MYTSMCFLLILYAGGIAHRIGENNKVGDAFSEFFKCVLNARLSCGLILEKLLHEVC